MKKVIILFVISILLLTSCSIFTEVDEEPILFFDTHNMSVWERTGGSPEKKYFLRILSNPKKMAKIYVGSTDRNCYKTELTQKINDISIDEDIVNRFSLSGYNEEENYSSFSFGISDGVLIEFYSWQTVHNTGGYTHYWVKSEVDVEELKLCN